MNLGEYIAQLIEQQGHSKIWLAEKSKIRYKTLVDRIINNRFEQVEDFLRLAKVLNIDLNELKEKF